MRIKKWHIFYTVIMVIMPILNQYQISIFVPIELFAILSSIYYFIEQRKIRLNSKYDLFMLYGFFIAIISTMTMILLNSRFEYSIGSYFLRMIKYIVVFIGIIIASREYFDFEVAIKWYERIITVCSIMIILQYIIYLVTGEVVIGLLPNTTLNYEDGMATNAFINYISKRLDMGFPFRPSGFFIEPAHFSIYVLPWLILKVFSMDNKGKMNMWISIVAIFITASSLGMAGSILIFVYYLWKQMKKGKIGKKVFRYIPIIIIAMGIIIIFSMNTDGFWFSLRSKLNSLQNLSEASSLTYRLFRGLIFYWNIGLFYKLFGVGYGNLAGYYHATEMNLYIDSGVGSLQVAYMNGIQEILNTFGIVGTVLFCVWLFDSIKKSNINALLGVAFIIILFTSDYYDTANYILLVVMMLCCESKRITKLKE